MPTRYFPPVDEELKLFRELEVRRARRRVLQQKATRQQADTAGAIHRDYPHLKGGVVSALAQAGVSPDDPRIQGVAEKAAGLELTHGMGFRGVGETVNPKIIKKEQEENESSWTDPLKAVSRAVFAGSEGLLQEVTHPLTALAVARHDPDTSLGEAWDRRPESILRMGAKGEDLGEGWFSGGEAKEKLKIASQRQTLPEFKRNLEPGDQQATLGRIVANRFVEPGSKPFDALSGTVDAAVAFTADPAAGALNAVGRSAKARRAFNSKPEWMSPLVRRMGAKTGLIDGRRRTVLPEAAKSWWTNSGEANRLKDWLVKQDNPYEIWTGLRKGVDRTVATRLAKATDHTQVHDILGPELGVTVSQKPMGNAVSRGVGRAVGSERGAAVGVTNAMRAGVRGQGGQQVIKGFDDVRFLQWQPHDTIEARNLDQAAEDLDRWMKGAKLSREKRAKRVSQILELEDGDSVGLLNVAKATMEDAFVSLTKRGIDESKARELTRLFDEQIESMRAYNINEIGNEAAHPLLKGDAVIMQDGMEKVITPGPHVSTEFINRKIPLPDMQAIRQHTSAIAPLFDIPGVQATDQITRTIMSQVWKPLQLLRGAYVLRVGGEEQVRLAAAGYDSMLNHPARYIMALAGRKSKQKSVAGREWEEVDEFTAQMQRFGSRYDNRAGGHLTNEFQIVNKNHERAVDGWAFEVGLHTNDPLSMRVANNGLLKGDSTPRTDLEGVDAIKEWYWSGTGQKFRKEAGEANDAILTDRAVSDAYVDSVVERIDIKVNGNDDVRQAIVTGMLDGQSVRGQQTHKNLKKALEGRRDSLPDWVKVRRAEKAGVTEPLHRLVDFLGDNIMSKPTNAMSRAPMFRQAHWQKAGEVAGFMDEATQQAVLKSAKDSKVDREIISQIEDAIAHGPGDRLTDIGQVETLANAHATSQVKKLLYDLTERGQLSDMAHNIAPFLEAQKEIMTAWGRIIRENPKVVRRFQQGVEGARGEGHFFFDENGEEKFRYPGAGLVSKFVLGEAHDRIQASFTGRVAGVNLFAGTLLPGFGPAVQLPAAALLSSKPTWTVPGTDHQLDMDKLREEVLFPFGEPEGPMDALRPAWMKRIAQVVDGPEGDRIYGNSVFDVAKALMQTGEYSVNSEPEVARLMDEAKDKAKGLMLLRAAAQFVLPTGPGVQFDAADIEGEWWSFQALAGEFHSLQAEVGEAEAVATYLQRFGPNAHLLLQSKSREIVKRSTSKKGYRWERENQHIMDDERYSLAAGYIAGDDPDGEFHYPAYERQFETGTRENLGPEESVRLANEMKGRIIYQQAKDKIEGNNSDEARVWLQMVRQALREEYPGFDGYTSQQERARTEDVIRDMERLAKEPSVQDNSAVQGMKLYLQAREKAQRAVEELGGQSTTFKSSKETAHIRQWLRQVAEQVASAHPEFMPMWDRVFSRELSDDEVAPPVSEQGGERQPIGVSS